MNCREFENIINDIARAKLIDGSIRAEGLAHTDACARCAARLADERALSVGLKSLSESEEAIAAPLEMEFKLLEAFRVRGATAPIAPAVIRPAKWRLWGLPRAAWAAAAAILLIFGFILYRSTVNKPPKDEVLTVIDPQAPAPAVTPETTTDHGPSAPQPRRKTRVAQPRRENRLLAGRPFIRESITAYAVEREVVTDFYPLHYGGDQSQMESGEVIRVQMPRSALVRFGLPVNIERADVPVTADLLLGEDGLARAIRFVR